MYEYINDHLNHMERTGAKCNKQCKYLLGKLQHHKILVNNTSISS